MSLTSALKGFADAGEKAPFLENWNAKDSAVKIAETASADALKADSAINKGQYSFDIAMHTGEEEFYNDLAALRVTDYKKYVHFVSQHNAAIKTILRPLYAGLIAIYKIRQITDKKASERASELCMAVLKSLKAEFEDGLTSSDDLRKEQEKATVTISTML